MDKWAEDRTKLALISLDPSGEHSRQHTFWDLKVQSNRFANVLRDLGVTKGARVFLMLPRIPEWYVAMLGLMKLGAVPMPATTLCTPSDIVYRGERSGSISGHYRLGELGQAGRSCGFLSFPATLDGSGRRAEGLDILRTGDGIGIGNVGRCGTNTERRPVTHILHLRDGRLSQDWCCTPKPPTDWATH